MRDVTERKTQEQALEMARMEARARGRSQIAIPRNHES